MLMVHLTDLKNLIYDFRKLNKYVNVRSAKIPTIPQVTQWMGKEPFMLLSKFDKKN